jgi:hypothetical protein
MMPANCPDSDETGVKFPVPNEVGPDMPKYKLLLGGGAENRFGKCWIQEATAKVKGRLF